MLWRQPPLLKREKRSDSPSMAFWNQRGFPKGMSVAGAHWLALLCCGVFSVCLGQAPSNDNFTNATPLYGDSVTFSGTLVGATYEAGESQLVYRWFEGGSVWWSWTASNSSQVVISTVTQEAFYNYWAFAVYSATNVTDITDNSQLDWNFFDWGFRMTNHYAAFSATAGTTYYIRALGNPAGPFTLRLTATNSPVILTSPQEQTVPESGSGFFSVFAAGLRPLKYQWRFEGNNLPGKTGPCLELHYLTANRAGGYSVVVSNSSGAITSTVASLAISPTNPPLLLEALGLSATNRFAFGITGETGRQFRVWASTNLINWSDEETLRYCPYRDCYALLQNTNPTSVFSIPMVNPREFLRVSRHMHKDICVAHLKQIDFAIKLWAVETKADSTASVSEADIVPYITDDVVCPSGGTTFSDSYTVTTAADQPTCQKAPATHYLIP